MNFKRQRREEVTVNLTPLIDIVFLLLIFFMVSTTFKEESHLNIDLPEASAEPSNAPAEAIEIVVSAEGTYQVNAQSLVNQQLDTLRRAIHKTLNGRESAPVVITADTKAPHGAVVKAMDAAGQLGLVNLSITTQQDPDER
ncbi:ExbD/TolR family protein [Oceanobacter kriegii]|uniref:ExbD/TolR family protein n=1 Tax=Oceanobacter kriegii TaxID=64972 RepID=UPI0004178D5B|nr:biopolymer transporter ExbD [Oceanobacter kriegii]